MQLTIIIYTKILPSSKGSSWSTAHSSIVRDRPSLTAHKAVAPEERVGIILLLDGKKSVIVGAEEFLLEVGLLEITLVHVDAAARGHGLKLGHILVSNGVLVRDHL